MMLRNSVALEMSQAAAREICSARDDFDDRPLCEPGAEQDLAAIEGRLRRSIGMPEPTFSLASM
jgi:hypothetical protein